MNKKILIVLVALCLIIGVGVAGTLMMTGGSEAVGCEVRFDGSSQLRLYRGVDSEDGIDVAITDLPFHLTVTEETEGKDITWYCLEGNNWPESLADYHYVISTGWTLIEKKDEAPIEAVALTGDIVINSEDTQLSANVVDDKTVAEIEDGLSLPQADANVSRETYCFDIRSEEEAPTTVTVSGLRYSPAPWVRTAALPSPPRAFPSFTSRWISIMEKRPSVLWGSAPCCFPMCSVSSKSTRTQPRLKALCFLTKLSFPLRVRETVTGCSPLLERLPPRRH